MARDDDFEVVVVREDTGSGLIPGFLLGALLGAAIGLIRAPRSGLQTRRVLTHRLQDAVSTARANLPGQRRG